MTKIKIKYDYSEIDRIAGIPTIGQLIKFQHQLAKVESSYKCDITEAKNHGWSWVMCRRAQWMAKRGTTSYVAEPTDPGLFTGSSNVLKAAYEQKLKLYEEFEEHQRNALKVIQAVFEEDLLIDLETDGMLLGVTPIEVYEHMWNSFLLDVDKDREILKTRELLKVEYDPDRIVQVYYKHISETTILLTALKERVTEAEMVSKFK